MIWLYLTGGASIHIPDERTRPDPSSLRDWLVEQEITITFCRHRWQSRRCPDLATDPALRILLIGADTLHRPPPPSLPFALVNNYGLPKPSATSGLVLLKWHGSAAPIGRPIDNTEAHVLDENLTPCRTARRASSTSAAEAWLVDIENRPDLTAERFSPTFPDTPGARMYGPAISVDADDGFSTHRPHRPTGEIRGFRIELGDSRAVSPSTPMCTRPWRP